MSAELHTADDGRPNVSGDLPTLFQVAPMFRRTVAGYDRFQVDTYVRWAEDELATAGREREHLLAAHLDTRAALDEARELLCHSAGGSEFLQTSRRIGALLAGAADEAEALRAEGEAARAAASAEAERLLAQGRQQLDEADAEAERVRARAAASADSVATEAGRILEQARATAAQAGAEAQARLAEVEAMEQRAEEEAGRIRQRAQGDARAARLQARAEVVGMLGTGREERRRADAAAAAVRERLDREAAARRAAVLAEVSELEQRRAALLADLALLDGLGSATPDPLPSSLRTQFDRLARALPSGTITRRTAPRPPRSVGGVRHP